MIFSIAGFRCAAILYDYVQRSVEGAYSSLSALSGRFGAGPSCASRSLVKRGDVLATAHKVGGEGIYMCDVRAVRFRLNVGTPSS